MKESYKYEDGIVKIVDYDNDDNKKIIKREYQDNIEDILIIENEIEELENNKEAVLEDANDYNDKIKIISKNKRRTALKCLIIPNVLRYIINFINLDLGLEIFNKIYEYNSITEKEILLFIFSSTLVYYTFEMINYNLAQKHVNRNLNILNLDIEILNEMIQKRKNKLKDLNDIKQKNNEKELNTNSYINIDYKEKLKDLRNDLRIYSELTNRYDEFLKYYNENSLEENLIDEFNDYEIGLIKKYYKAKVKRK